MPVNKRILRLFLSSPGDVGPQRQIVREVVDALNVDPLVAERCALEVVPGIPRAPPFPSVAAGHRRIR